MEKFGRKSLDQRKFSRSYWNRKPFGKSSATALEEDLCRPSDVDSGSTACQPPAGSINWLCDRTLHGQTSASLLRRSKSNIQALPNPEAGRASEGAKSRAGSQVKPTGPRAGRTVVNSEGTPHRLDAVAPPLKPDRSLPSPNP